MDNLEEYYKKALEASKSAQFELAEKYCNEVIKLDSSNYKALLLKANSIAKQCSITSLRLEEAIEYYIKAYINVPGDLKVNLKDKLKKEIVSVYNEVLDIFTRSYKKNPSSEVADAFLKTVKGAMNSLNYLSSKTDLNIDPFTCTETYIDSVYETSVFAYTEKISDEKGNTINYTRNLEGLLALVELAYSFYSATKNNRADKCGRFLVEKFDDLTNTYKEASLLTDNKSYSNQAEKAITKRDYYAKKVNYDLSSLISEVKETREERVVKSQTKKRRQDDDNDYDEDDLSKEDLAKIINKDELKKNFNKIKYKKRTVKFDKQEVADYRGMALMCYFPGFKVIPLFSNRSHKDSEYVNFHLNQAYSIFFSCSMGALYTLIANAASFAILFLVYKFFEFLEKFEGMMKIIEFGGKLIKPFLLVYGAIVVIYFVLNIIGFFNTRKTKGIILPLGGRYKVVK